MYIWVSAQTLIHSAAADTRSTSSRRGVEVVSRCTLRVMAGRSGGCHDGATPATTCRDSCHSAAWKTEHRVQARLVCRRGTGAACACAPRTRQGGAQLHAVPAPPLLKPRLQRQLRCAQCACSLRCDSWGPPGRRCTVLKVVDRLVTEANFLLSEATPCDTCPPTMRMRPARCSFAMCNIMCNTHSPITHVEQRPLPPGPSRGRPGAALTPCATQVQAPLTHTHTHSRRAHTPAVSSTDQCV